MESEVVKTYFNGAVTQQQLMTVIVAVIAVFLVLSLAKKLVRFVLTVAIIVGVSIYFGLVSPEQLRDASKVVSEKGQEVFTQIADTSKNVKVDTSNGLDVKVCIDNNWYSVNDISSFVKAKDGVYSVSINGQDYAVTDEGIKEMLDLLKR